jgi:hypothetical protein
MHHQRIDLEKTATLGLLGLYNLCGNQVASKEFEKTAGLPGKLLFNLFKRKALPYTAEEAAHVINLYPGKTLTRTGIGAGAGGLIAGGAGGYYLGRNDGGVNQQSLNPAAGGVPSENPFKAPAAIPQASQQAPVKAPAAIPQASQQNLFEDPPEVSFDDPIAGMTQNQPEDFVGSMLKTLPKKPLASQQVPIEPLIQALAEKPEINQGVLFRSLPEQPQVSQQTQFEDPPEVPVENPTEAPVETPTQLPPNIQQKEIGKNTPTPQIPDEKGNFPWLPLAAGIPAAGLGLYGLSQLMSRRDRDEDERKRRVYV